MYYNDSIIYFSPNPPLTYHNSIVMYTLLGAHAWLCIETYVRVVLRYLCYQCVGLRVFFVTSLFALVDTLVRFMLV